MAEIEQKADVVIIGGGINGCSLAYQLAQRDIKVIVCERSYLGAGATGRCGAGIRQQWSTKENTQLAIQSVKIFEQLEQELGCDIGLRQGGYLIAIHTEHEMKQAKKNLLMQKSLGLDVSLVSPEEMKEIVPLLDTKGMNAIGATFCPTDGHADPFKTTHAYAQAALRYGAHIYKFTDVLGFHKEKKSLTQVLTNKGTISTSIVVNAAGAWSPNLASLAGIQLPNKPYRKEILVTERVQPLFQAMVISFKDGIYFSQQDEGQILGGIPISHEKAGYATVPTYDFLQHMSTTLARYAPALQFVNIIRQWTGYYDVTPDARPILGEVTGLKGFLQCNGFSGHGFMLSPMVTKMLADYIVDGKVHPILKKLTIERFKDKHLHKEVAVVG